ncbi:MULTISPECIES: SRPBCC family protein [Paenibacillus]|nr:hypothetical protein [Paenibacillus caseinilyticus]MCZ8519597.1 hypothetical protein [Paenibacillus caseinilyticus]
MPKIHRESLIDAPSEQVWDAGSDVGAVPHRPVPGYTGTFEGNEAGGDQ